MVISPSMRAMSILRSVTVPRPADRRARPTARAVGPGSQGPTSTAARSGPDLRPGEDVVELVHRGGEGADQVDVVGVGEGEHAPQAVGQLVRQRLVEVLAGAY